ncbi:VOC family protein [Halorubellus salinus]|uniref:VOC family protein n=1 Tax=Halorubellus salinus TaxID=755309 RepID=UPI001D08C4E1|nr:VOC family protein [Halorubellus salinus]
MHVLGLDRVIIATNDLTATSEPFEDLLGLSFGDLLEPTTSTDSGGQDVQNVISTAGIELVAPRGSDGELDRFLDEHGPGLYAVSLRVADLDAAVEELSQKGVETVGEYRANDFAEVFLHPRYFGGAMVILAEYDAPHPSETASLPRRRND